MIRQQKLISCTKTCKSKDYLISSQKDKDPFFLFFFLQFIFHKSFFYPCSPLYPDWIIYYQYCVSCISIKSILVNGINILLLQFFLKIKDAVFSSSPSFFNLTLGSCRLLSGLMSVSLTHSLHPLSFGNGSLFSHSGN